MKYETQSWLATCWRLLANSMRAAKLNARVIRVQCSND